MKKYFLTGLILIGVLFLLNGCQSKEDEAEGTYYDVYYVNRDETSINKLEQNLNDVILSEETLEASEEVEDSTDEESDESTKLLIVKMLTLLATAPENVEYKATIPEKVGTVKYIFENNQVTLYFSETYSELSTTTEVLCRAAIVKTLTQLDGVDYVSFVVDDQPIKDNSGNLIGLMTDSMFLDSDGNEINSYEKAKLKLFFANEDGTELVEAERTVVYSSNISLVKLVVEQLIEGPVNTAVYPTINPETSIINITVTDGICYVNLDKAFLTKINNVSAEVTIYSIVNSLTALTGVNKVQILIEGNTEVQFREALDLSVLYERNLTILQ